MDALPPASDDWVLFRAESRLGPWLRRSASAHTLLLGCGFASLMLFLTVEALRGALPAEARIAAGGVLVLAIAAAAAPMPVLAWVHHRRRVVAMDLDPMAITFHTPRGRRRVPLAELAWARAAAEPSFAGERPDVRRGPLRDLPGFHAALHVRLADGTRYEFVTGHARDVASLIGWLDVLGAGDRVHREPSGLAAQRAAGDALARAGVHLALAALAVASALGVVALDRVWPQLLPHDHLLALLGVATGCALYLGSYRSQLRAADEWLDGLGLRAGPAPGEPAAAPHDVAGAPGALAARARAPDAPPR